MMKNLVTTGLLKHENMVKILITGGAGFIPSCLAEKLAENPENFIVIVDNFITGSTVSCSSLNSDNRFFSGKNFFSSMAACRRSAMFSDALIMAPFAHQATALESQGSTTMPLESLHKLV